MDGSVVNVALPALQGVFHSTSAETQWIVQSYALFCSALLLLGGTLGDHLGRSRVFAWGVVIFAAASAACAGAQTLGQLVGARAIQGIGAALLIPQGLAMLSEAFPAEERAHAIGIWSAWTSVFVALGPILGGTLVQYGRWRWIFLLNLPFTILIFVLMPRMRMARPAADSGLRQLDYLGAALSTLGFGAIIYAFSFGPQLGWQDMRVEGSLIAGAAFLAAFLWSQHSRPNAMMPLALFRNRRFAAINLLTLVIYGALGGALYIIPFFLIQVRHFTPSESGAALLPMILIMFTLSSRVGAAASKFGESRFLITGTGIVALSFTLFALLANRTGYVTSILPGVAALGLGMTLLVAPLTNVVMSSVPQKQTGVASAVNNSISRTASLLFLSIAVLVLATQFNSTLRHLLEASSLPQGMRDAVFGNRAMMLGLPVPTQFGLAPATAAHTMVDAAFVRGFQTVMYACAGTTLLGLASIFLTGAKGADK
jgi:EmrB/QacA subfamily drug resistance transporter